MKVLFLTKTNLLEKSGATIRDKMFLDFYKENYGEENVDGLSLFLDSSQKSVIKDFNGEREKFELSKIKWYQELMYNVVKGVPNRSAMKYVEEDQFQNYDLVHIASPYVYKLGKKIAERNNAKIVFDEHNAEYDLIKQDRGLLGKWFSLNVKKIEKKAVEESSISFCCSQEDKKKLWNKPEVIPNAVKLDEYDLDATMPEEYEGVENRAVFLGSLNYGPNERAAEIIIDKIAPATGNWTFYLVGRKPSRKIRQKAQEQDNVKLVGEVEKIDPYLANSDICLAPLESGSGTRIKILEYLAFKKPVIATRKAAEGIKSKAVLIEDNYQNCSDLIRKVSERDFDLPEKYKWENIQEKIETSIKEENLSNL